jgi:transcriptional regulator with XRE-family HTH domain
MPMLKGIRIKEARERAGLTQKELAMRCGRLSVRQLQRIENGESDVTGDTLIKIARELNVSLDYLAGRVDEPNQTLGIELSPELKRLVTRFSALPKDIQDAIMSLVFRE